MRAKKKPKKQTHKIVKTSLKSVVSKTLLPEIDILVKRCTRVIHDAYLFIKAYVLHQAKTGDYVPWLDHYFITQCINTLGTKNNSGPKPAAEDQILIDTLNNFYHLEFQPLYHHHKQDHDLRNLNQVLSYLATTMETSYKVNLGQHYIQRLSKFVRIFCGSWYNLTYGQDIITPTGQLSCIHRAAVVDTSNFEAHIKLFQTEKKAKINKLLTCLIHGQHHDIPPEVQAWFDLYGQAIIPQAFEKSPAYDCKVHPLKYLSCTLNMAKYYENYNDEIDRAIQAENERKGEDSPEQIRKLKRIKLKLFRVLPLSTSNIPKYIKLDTTALIDLFGLKGEDRNKPNLFKVQVWNRLFNLKKRVFRKNNGFSFNYSIQTDGVGCNLLFEQGTPDEMIHKTGKGGRKSGKGDQHLFDADDEFEYIEDLKKDKLKILETKNIVCADPGMTSLVYMMDQKGQKFDYTRHLRNQECYINQRHLTTLETKTEAVTKAETALSVCSAKSVSADKFKDYIRAKHEANKITQEHYETERYRKLNFRAYIRKQQHEVKILNQLEARFGPKEETVICIGDWSRKSGSCIRGPSSLGIGMRRLLARRFPVYLIDEYRTSKVCCNCQGRVEES